LTNSHLASMLGGCFAFGLNAGLNIQGSPCILQNPQREIN
jgi:hypothetical protein